MELGILFGIWCLGLEILNILMNFFLEKLQNKLHEIQHSEEHVKRRWMAALSACTMLFVVALWVVYMNFSIHAVTAPEGTDTIPAQAETPHSQSALASFSASVREFGNTFAQKSKEGISSLIQRVMTPREVELKNN